MRNVIIAAALTAISATLASARQYSNGTHFVDPATGQDIARFECDVDRGKASSHFNKTVSRLSRGHRHQNFSTRAAGFWKRQSTLPETIIIPLYIHVLTRDDADSIASITQDMATQQAIELNMAYNPYGITFDLQDTTFHANDAWAAGDEPAMTELKTALRQGTYSTLNLYFHTDLSGGVLGTCTLPSQVTANTPITEYASDGCNVNAATMPGGILAGYNQGKTAVHETGHWLGLLHTFEGYSCEGSGDLIDDTPMQSISTNGCPSKPPQDSCPMQTGVDAVHNYMDYSTDECYTNFTPGQVSRIANLWNEYRKGF